MKRLALVALALCLTMESCVRGAPEQGPQVGSKNARRTAAIVQYTLRDSWIMSGFYRPGDEVIMLPVQVALTAGDSSACILTNAQWASWETNAVVACRTPWRFRRSF